MTLPLHDVTWPLSRLDEGVDLLARRIGHPPSGVRPGAAASLPAVFDDRAAFGRAIERVLFPYGLDVEPAVLLHREAAHLPAPGIVRVPGDSVGGAEPSFLIVAGRRGAERLLGRDRRWHRFDRLAVAAAIRQPVEAPHREEVDAVLSATAVEPSRRGAVARALLLEVAGDAEAADVWHVGPDPGGRFAWQLRRSGTIRQSAWLLVLHAVQFTLWIASWVLIGRGALEGRTEWGWLTGWALLIATMVPLQLWTSWLQGALALGVGRLLKERLLVGAMRLEPDEIRHQGSGQLLGRVLESDAVEGLAIGGGLQAALAVVELVMAGVVLWFGAAGGPHAALLAACVAIAGIIGWGYHQRRGRWSEARLAMTHDLVEQLAGYRTRLAQQAPDRFHADEDRSLEEYLARSQALDARLPVLVVGVPRGWMVLAIAALAPALLTGAPATALAISLGGVLLAAMALRRAVEGISLLSAAAVSWQEAQPLFAAAARRPAPAILDDRTRPSPGPGGSLDVRDVSFQYPGRPRPVLQGATLQARPGARVLVRGASGGGKSTLASLVSGLRTPGAGLILVDGIDRGTLGPAGWRRLIATAPQFHENHVVSDTFAFNLLMGRQWPPENADLDEAEAIARELGLGDLLDRMPAGLHQLVGEGGWQLSHGERSRLFLARTLLQGSGVMILDESFAALDPATLRDALECVLRRAPTLLVIAHP